MIDLLDSNGGMSIYRPSSVESNVSEADVLVVAAVVVASGPTLLGSLVASQDIHGIVHGHVGSLFGKLFCSSVFAPECTAW